MAAPKPVHVPVTVQADNIPLELRAAKRWVAWLARWDGPKLNKRPGSIERPGVGLTNWANEGWVDFDTALAAYNAHRDVYGGVGFVMSNSPGVTGVDLDKCRDPKTGEIAPWAAEVIAKLDSYTEVSPSGTGLRVFVTGDCEDWQARDDKAGLAIEVYGGSGGRFLTVTGERLAGTAPNVRRARSDVLDQLKEKHYAAPRTAEVEDLHLPDVVPDFLLPDVADLGLPAHARNFLSDGPTGADHSRQLFAAAIALARAGLSREEVFSILANNEHALEIAERHWSGNADKALRYLWKHSALKGEARAQDFKQLSLNDFDDLDPPAAHAEAEEGNTYEATQEPTGTAADDFDVLPDDEGESAPAPPKALRFTPVMPATFLQRAPASWIIKGVVPRAGLAVIYGASGSGKTFLTLDMVSSIVRGLPWRGATAKRGRGVYVVAEGASGFRNRLDAYCAFHGVDPAGFEIGVIADAPNLLEKADVRDLLKALIAFGPVDFIVIDTYARVMAGGNENDAKDVGQAVAHCDIIHRKTGALVILVHHSGKDASRGARGSGALRAAADLEIEVTQTREYRAATITKMKDGEDGKEYRFRLQEVQIGEDEDGDPITSCVIEHRDAPPPGQGPEREMPKGIINQTVLQTVGALVELGGDPTYNETIEACVSRIELEEGKRDRRRELVIRALDRLSDSGHLILGGGLVTIAK